MTVHISFASQSPTSTLTVSMVFEELGYTEPVLKMKQAQGSLLEQILKKEAFSGKKDEALYIPLLGADLGSAYLMGLGKKDKKPLSKHCLEVLGTKIYAALAKAKGEKIYVDLRDEAFGDNALSAAYMANGAYLRSWRFDQYKTKKNEKPDLQEIVFLVNNPAAAQKEFEALKHVSDGVLLTRTVVSEPPNILYPESMAQIAKEKLKPLGVKVEILDEQDMKRLGMNSLLCVGQGSVRESRLIILQWMNGPKDQAPIAIVGKGVTFDTGGISIKPSGGMEDMKYDMGGSGVVLGLLQALALRKAPVNVVGVMGMVENMPSGSATRPSDIVVSMSGQTIEVLNTDAEGRLVLADALWYTQDRFKPQAMIDLATLTGAIIVALGNEYAGLFSNNDELAKRITKISTDVGEPTWRMPLCAAYDKDIDSDVADVKNIGSGRGAGSATAAHFLQRFVNNVPWAHLDIAGMAWDKKIKPLSGKGATGYGVRLLNALIQTHYEKV